MVLLNGFLGWGAPCPLMQSMLTGNNNCGFFKIAIPFNRIGGTPDANIVAVVQDGSANIQTVH